MRGVVWCGVGSGARVNFPCEEDPGLVVGPPWCSPVWELGGELVNLEHRASLRNSIVPHPSVPGDVNLERGVVLSPVLILHHADREKRQSS